MEAREKLEKIISEYDSVADARNNNARELRHANLETGLVVSLVSIVAKSQDIYLNMSIKNIMMRTEEV
ncbi:hypothetical protein Tco_0645876 [Tanacetum coccineum]